MTNNATLTKEQRYQLGFRLASIRGSGDGIDAMSDTELLEALRHEGAHEKPTPTERLDAMLRDAAEREEAETEAARQALIRELGKD